MGKGEGRTKRKGRGAPWPVSGAFPHDVGVGRMASFAVGIVFNIVIIAYLAQLEGSRCWCAASSGWMPTFLRWSLTASVVLVPFTLFLRTRLDVMKRMWDAGYLQWLGVGVFVMGLVKAYAMLNYSLDLYRCGCADDWRRVLMMWEGALAVLLYFGLFALVAYALVRRSIA